MTGVACSMEVGTGDDDVEAADAGDPGTTLDGAPVPVPGQPDAAAVPGIDASLPDPDARPPGGAMFLLPWTADDSYRVSQFHNTGSHTGKGSWAWDFALPQGTLLRASHNGVVRAARGDSTIGGCDSAYANDANYVVIDRGDGVESLYLHLTDAYVSAGDVVVRGDPIGTSGQTGWACGAHLHFQIQQSPDGGGTTSWWNQSVHEYFYDTGEAWAPPLGSEPVSKNGVIDLP